MSTEPAAAQTATVYFNLYGPLQLSSFMHTPTRIRGSKLIGLAAAEPKAEDEADRLDDARRAEPSPIADVAAADLARTWTITVHSYAVSEGIPADVRTSRETLTVTAAVDGATTVEVDVNDRPFRLPAFVLRVIYADAATGDVVRIQRAHYIPVLATTDVLQAFGNARRLTNIDADPVQGTAYQVDPEVLQAVIDAAR